MLSKRNTKLTIFWNNIFFTFVGAEQIFRGLIAQDDFATQNHIEHGLAEGQFFHSYYLNNLQLRNP